VRVTVAGKIVAESTRALRLEEKGYPPVYYLPRSDADMSLARSDHALHLLSVQGRLHVLQHSHRRSEIGICRLDLRKPYEAVATLRTTWRFIPRGRCNRSDRLRTSPTHHPTHPQELNMPKTTPEQNKAIVLEAFDTLFNKRDYAQQNASGRRSTSSTARTSHRDAKGCSLSSARRQIRCAMKTNSSSQKATMSLRMAVSPEWEGPRPGLRPTLSDSKTVSWPSTGMYCRTKPHRKESVSGLPMFGTRFPS
jgi:hypothetical protein